MEIVLQQDFPALGYVGDKVKVRGGYARNYLIPRGIALEMTSRNAKLLRHRLAQVEAKRAKLRAAATEASKAYEGLILEFHLKIGEKGKSFGAISLRDVELALKEKGFNLDKRQIRLLEPIKAGGEYPIEIKLHAEVTATVTARVIVERIEKKPEIDDKGSKGKRGRGRRSREGAEASDASPETDAVTVSDDTSSAE